MPEAQLYLEFVAATCILMLIPGPNVALIVATSMTHGTPYGLLTVAGVGIAVAVQLGITVLGTEAVLGALAASFEWVRWCGVLYLLWLGAAQWRAPAADLGHARPERRERRAILARGFFVSLTNPKVLLFYGAFLPQFIAPDRPAGPQLAALAATFLCLELLLDSVWAVLAARVRFLLAAGRTLNRVSGGFLICASLGLALARRP
jgi:homoserine/homoserine lactone efflux protein